SPRLHPGDMHRAAEIVPVLGSGEPARLAGGLACRATARRRAVSLVMPITRVGAKQLVAALAFTTFRPGHRVPSRGDTWSANAEPALALEITSLGKPLAQSHDAIHCLGVRTKPDSKSLTFV